MKPPVPLVHKKNIDKKHNEQPTTKSSPYTNQITFQHEKNPIT